MDGSVTAESIKSIGAAVVTTRSLDPKHVADAIVEASRLRQRRVPVQPTWDDIAEKYLQLFRSGLDANSPSL